MLTFTKAPVPVLPSTRHGKILKAMEEVTKHFNAAAGMAHLRDEQAKNEFVAWRKAHPDQFKSEVRIDTVTCEPMQKLRETYEKAGRARAILNLARSVEVNAGIDAPFVYNEIPAKGTRKIDEMSKEEMVLRVLLTERNWAALARLAIAHVVQVNLHSITFDRSLSLAWKAVGTYHREYFKELAQRLTRVGIPQTDEFLITGAMQKNWDAMNVSSRVALFEC